MTKKRSPGHIVKWRKWGIQMYTVHLLCKEGGEIGGKNKYTLMTQQTKKSTWRINKKQTNKKTLETTFNCEREECDEGGEQNEIISETSFSLHHKNALLIFFI